MGVVYIIKNNVNGKQYVGSTLRSFEQRLREHRLANTNSPLHTAINKYGWENFSHEVVFTSDDIDALRKREGFEMGNRNTFGEDGYNKKGTSGVKNPHNKSKMMAFRANTTVQEILKEYCDDNNTTTSEALQVLIELGGLFYLSNKYNDTANTKD